MPLSAQAFGGISWSRAKWLLLPLALLPTICALDTPFLLDYDDWWIIPNNPLIQKGWSGLHELATGTLEHGHMQLAYLSAALDHALCGDWAGGYRLVNALLHGLSVLLVFRLGRTLFSGVAVGAPATAQTDLPLPMAHTAAFMAALFFAVHPLTVESVAWVIQRNNILAQFFCLAALSVYVGPASCRSDRLEACPTGVSWKRLALAFLLLLLAQFGKSSAIGFWFVFAAAEALWFQGARWRRALRAGVMLLPCLLGGAMALSAHTEQFIAPLGGDSAWLRLAGALQLHGRAWALVLWPFNLSAFYHISPTNTLDGWLAVGLLVPLVVVLLYHRLGLGWRRGVLLVIWAVAGFLPNMNPVRSLGFLLQDRYVYLAVPPIMLLAAELLGRALARAREQRDESHQCKAAICVAAIIAIVLGTCAAVRSATWRSEPRLFADAAAKQAGSAFGHAYLAGNLYFHATSASSAQPPAGLSAAGWQARNRYLQTEYARLLSSGERQPVPQQPGALSGVRSDSLWPAELKHAMLVRSLEEHEAAMKCDDFDRLVYPLHILAEHAQLLLLFKRPEAASRIYRRIWEGRPERLTERGAKLEAVRFLAVESLRAKRYDEGLRYLEDGLKLEPDQPELLSNRLLAFEECGRVAEARAEAGRLLANPATAAVAREVLKRLGQTAR